MSLTPPCRCEKFGYMFVPGCIYLTRGCSHKGDVGTNHRAYYHASHESVNNTIITHIDSKLESSFELMKRASEAYNGKHHIRCNLPFRTFHFYELVPSVLRHLVPAVPGQSIPAEHRRPVPAALRQPVTAVL